MKTSPSKNKKGMKKGMEITTYSRAIRFSPEEFCDNGLELDGPFMELLLHWNGTDGFEPSFSDKKCHDLCLEAVVSYADTVSSVLKCAEREGLL